MRYNGLTHNLRSEDHSEHGHVTTSSRISVTLLEAIMVDSSAIENLRSVFLGVLRFHDDLVALLDFLGLA
jgi:hypothetical protein